MTDTHQPRPLFFLGNKRSGTSHLVRLMNIHPDVFVTHESDAIWILYQAAAGKPFRRYPRDGALGMKATLETCADLLGPAPQHTVAEFGVSPLFFRIQARLMERGSRVQDPLPGRLPQWVGDKKPVQQADPDILAFIAEHFPQARYLHIIRDPRAVIASAERMTGTSRDQGGAETIDDDGLRHRGGLPLSADAWASVEEWVEQAKDRGLPIRSLRFEDLSADPAAVMGMVFGFLGIEASAEHYREIEARTSRDQNRKYEGLPLEVTERAQRIMEGYGYA